MLLSAAASSAARRCFSSSAAAASAAGGFQRVGVLGLGLMGHGIAQTAAAAGFQVVAVDSEDRFVQKGLAMIRGSLTTIASKSVAKGAATKEQADEQVALTLARITTATQREALAECDLVIDAVPETMEVKTPVYRDLARITRPDAVLASNTSGLAVKELAALSGRPETTIGLHYFNPVQLMALVEVVRLDSTPQRVVDAALAFVRAVGKTPVLCKDTPGFVVNRLLVPYMAQALQLAEAGVASYKDVDIAMKLGAGHPMCVAGMGNGKGLALALGGR